jgi:hypothetical protein
MPSKIDVHALMKGIINNTAVPIAVNIDGKLKIQSDAGDSWFRVVSGQDYYIHAGHHFFVKGVMDITGAATVVNFMFYVPQTDSEINAFSIIYGEAEFLLEIYEGGAVSDNGTPVTYYNNNRNSTAVALLQPYASPTVTNYGTLIWSSRTGPSKHPSGVTMGTNYKILPKKNTNYIWKITKEEAGTHFLDYDFFWFEKPATV